MQNRRKSTLLKRLDTDLVSVSISPRRTRRKSMGPTALAAAKKEADLAVTKIPKSTSESHLKKAASRNSLQKNVAPAKTKTTKPGPVTNKTAAGKKAETVKKSDNTKENEPPTPISPKVFYKKTERPRIVRRESLLELETIDMNQLIESKKSQVSAISTL